MSSELFPAFIKLENRPCLVVGAGAIATSKIASLLRAERANYSRRAASQIRSSKTCLRRKYHLASARISRADDLHDIFLAIAATGSASVNREVFLAAQAHGILTNAVDDPPHCDFYFRLSFAAATSRSQFRPRAKAPQSPNAFAARSKPRSISLWATGSASLEAFAATSSQIIRLPKNAKSCSTFSPTARFAIRRIAKSNRARSNSPVATFISPSISQGIQTAATRSIARQRLTTRQRFRSNHESLHAGQSFSSRRRPR